MMKANHPKNVKRGGECAFIRESLPVRYFTNSYISKSFSLEVTVNNKKVFIIAVYRSPSQKSDEFDSYQQFGSFNNLL